MSYDKKKLTIYIISAFVLGWIFQVIGSSFAIKGNGVMFSQILSICMFAPFVATLIAKIPLQKSILKIKIKGNIPSILAAWFLPAILCILGGIIYFVLLPNRFDASLSYIKATYTQEMLSQLQQSGLSIPKLIGIQTIQAITWAPIINAVFAFGEEIGWRGAMYPMLKDRYGINKGRIIGGIIWGVWHWPVMLLAGYEYGFDYIGAPILGLVTFCLCCVSLGIFLDELYEKTSCIWFPSVAHGAINAIASLPMFFLNPIYARESVFGPACMGLISMIPLIGLAVAICLKNKKAQDVREK